MSINGINSSNLNSLAPTGMEGNYLTPDALMSFCQSRLRGLDDQIKIAFEKQQQANAKSELLSNLFSELGVANGTIKSEDLAPAMRAAAQKLVDAANRTTDPELKKTLLAQVSRFANTKELDGGRFMVVGVKTDSSGNVEIDGASFAELSAEQFKHYTADFVQQLQKDINSGSELSMINLQSLMSQRQSSVQLVTNMVQALGDQMNKVAANIGH